jgi:hypothetical protein
MGHQDRAEAATTAAQALLEILVQVAEGLLPAVAKRQQQASAGAQPPRGKR